MARLYGSYSKSMYDPYKVMILSLRSMGVGVTSIIRKLGFGTRQSLYNYFKKLKILGENKTTSLALSIKKALPLSLKIKHARKRVKEFYESMDGKVYISFSGGKDSTVLLHLVRSLYPDVKAVFSNTTNEYIEILEFVKSVSNVTWLKPKMSFTETIKKYGFPLVSKKVARSVSDLKHPTPRNLNSRTMYLTGVGSKGQSIPSRKLSNKWRFLVDEPFDITLKCCDVLKKKPLLEFEKQSGLKPFIGTSVYEGDNRQSNYLKYGCNIYEEAKERSRPLSIFSEDDIWAYIKKYKLEYSKIYDDVLIDNTIVKGEKRTGCAYCAFGVQFEGKDDNRFTRLEIRKPKQFKKMMGLKNNDVSYGEALDVVLGV